MSGFNGFGNINLSQVQAEEGRKTLPPGSYTCVIKSAKVEDTKGGDGKKLVVELADKAGGGSVTDIINLHNRNPQATEIGLRRLKALLVAAKHPNPNQPGDVASLKGLTVGVHVEQSDDWKDAQGNVRKGGGKPRNYGAYFTPEGVAGGTNSADGKPAFNDDIPF